MNAIALLEADHQRVQELFDEFRAAGERAHKKKQGIAERVFAELHVHTQLEEQIFYPAVRDQGGELADLIAESLEEHHVVDVLMENVEHHVEEEEKELFPKAKKHLGATLDDLGEELARRKEDLQAAAKR